MDKKIQKAVEILKQGGIIIFPTDTAFGIGCAIDNESAIERLFQIRKRPVTQATPVLVDTVKMAQDYLQPIPKAVIDKLIESYWPGALTIVLSCSVEKVPTLARGGGTTLGVRIPNHPIPRAIMQRLGKPILGPSANFHGEKTPYVFKDLNSELVGMVELTMEGDCGANEASTVINCAVTPWRILRQGKAIVDPSRMTG